MQEDPSMNKRGEKCMAAPLHQQSTNLFDTAFVENIYALNIYVRPVIIITIC